VSRGCLIRIESSFSLKRWAGSGVWPALGKSGSVGSIMTSRRRVARAIRWRVFILLREEGVGKVGGVEAGDAAIWAHVGLTEELGAAATAELALSCRASSLRRQSVDCWTMSLTATRVSVWSLASADRRLVLGRIEEESEEERARVDLETMDSEKESDAASSMA